VSDLQAGPEMDAAVARAVKAQVFWPNHDPQPYHESGGSDVPWSPSTDLNAAFEAAEKAGLLEWPNVLYHYEIESALAPTSRRDWKVWNADENEVVGRGDTPAEAISRAILKLAEPR
jgi:hypothetical protein